MKARNKRYSAISFSMTSVTYNQNIISSDLLHYYIKYSVIYSLFVNIQLVSDYQFYNYLIKGISFYIDLY